MTVKPHKTLAVGLSYYNDLKSIQRSIPTYIDGVDFVFAIDGRYSLRDGPDYSDDGSTEYLKQFDKVITDRYIGMEHDKRNRYLELAEEMDIDIMLMIDSDEYVIEADWDKFRDNLDILKRQPDIYGVKFYYTKNDWTAYPRIWVMPEQIRYYKCHNIFNVNGQIIRSPGTLKPVEGISMGMDDDLRSEEYLKMTSEYQKRMLDYEIPIRHALRDGRQI